MFKMVAVSNWELYRNSHRTEKIEDYVNHLANLEQSTYKPDMLILREKNLPKEQYEKLLKMVWERLENTEIELMPHTYLSVARQLEIHKIHLPFSLMKKFAAEKQLQGMKVVGTSIHSVEEAVMAERLGASYITAGHIFTTNCKPGLEPRGMEFLEKICESVRIPVYAIGGIHPDNLKEIRKSSAAGACMMSEYMKIGCGENFLR